MRLDRVVLCCLGLPLVSTMALAASPAAPTFTAPTFTAKERSIVERNEILARALPLDPWMVRRWLDKTPVHATVGPPGPKSATPLHGFDPARNPDISVTGRGSAEATYDLIRLIRKAAPPATKTP